MHEWDMTSSLNEIVGHETRELAERVGTAVYAVLNSVQDSISEYLCVPWPSLDGVTMAMPGVGVDTELIHFWHGAEERAPVIGMQAIRIADIAGTDGTTSTGT